MIEVTIKIQESGYDMTFSQHSGRLGDGPLVRIDRLVESVRAQAVGALTMDQKRAQVITAERKAGHDAATR